MIHTRYTRRSHVGLLLVVGLCCLQAIGVFAGPDQLFGSYDLIEATLEAPFESLLANSQTDDFKVTGTLSYADPLVGRRVSLEHVSISLRGHTSRQASECDFPKLALDLRATTRPAGSMFAGVDTVRLGSHCAERPDGSLTAKYGRWGNEKGPHRETVIYRLLEVMEIPAPQARPARITYVFANSGGAGTDPLVRNAMILEDDDLAIKRYRTIRSLPKKRFDTASSTFQAADVAKLVFAEAMIGNFDWCLRMFPGDTYRCNDRTPLWNIEALVTPNGTIPMIEDFDLAGMVVLSHPWFVKAFNRNFFPAATQPQLEVLSQVQRTRALFTREMLNATRAHFLERRSTAYAAVDSSVLDQVGKEVIREYLDAFFGAIETDEAFYTPVVADPDARAFIDAEQTQPVCGSGTIPAGTPVSQPIETKGDHIRVVVLDAHWEWAMQDACAIVRKEPIWIASSAVRAEFP